MLLYAEAATSEDYYEKWLSNACWCGGTAEDLPHTQLVPRLIPVDPTEVLHEQE